jgi:hypothetical protein
MSDSTRIASLEATVGDVAAYLEELRSALASHDAALGSQRLQELEERISPTTTGWGGSSTPRKPGTDIVAATLGNVRPYTGVANTLGDPTFEWVPRFENGPLVTTSWQAYGQFWEARYILESGSAPTTVNVYLGGERYHKDQDMGSGRVAVYANNASGGDLTGQITVEIRSKQATYNPAYNTPPYMVAAFKAVANNGWASAAQVEVEIRTTDGGDVLRANSGMVSLPWAAGVEYAPTMVTCATDPAIVDPLTYVDWYVVFRVRSTYTARPNNNLVTYTLISEPQLLRSWTPDPPVFQPLFGGWRPKATESVLPCAYMAGFDASGTYTTALNLAANGGCLAVPVVLTARMYLQSVSVWNTDAATARSWNWAIYDRLRIDSTAEASLHRIVSGTAAETFTPGAASKRTIAAAPVRTALNPGIYWLVVQNNHATSTFGVGSAASGTLSHNRAQTKTLTVPVGATLDFTAATWTKVTAIYAVVLEGAMWGQTSAF